MRNVSPISCILLILIATVSLSGLLGCGGDNSSPDAKTIVTFWTFWSEPAQKQALKKQIEEFEAQNADLHVEVTELTYTDGKAKLLSAFNSNSAPDVLELGSDWVAQFSSAGVLAERKDIDTTRFAATVLAPGRWNTGLYAVPWVVDTRVLFFNKALLSSAGVDTTSADTLWSDVLLHAEKVRTKGTDFYGFGANGDDKHRLYKKILPFFWSNGGQVLDVNGKPVLNSPQNVEALRTYLELARTGLFDTQAGLDQMFMQGKIAYWISGPWLAERIRKDNPTLQYSMAPLPTFPGGTSVSFAGGQYLAISTETKQMEGAARFVKFLTAPEHAMQFCKDLGANAPADISVANDPYLQSPARKAYTVQLKTARMTPVHPKWLDIEAIIEGAVVEALLGRKSEQQALDDAQYQTTQLLATGAVQSSDTSEH